METKEPLTNVTTLTRNKPAFGRLLLVNYADNETTTGSYTETV